MGRSGSLQDKKLEHVALMKINKYFIWSSVVRADFREFLSAICLIIAFFYHKQMGKQLIISVSNKKNVFYSKLKIKHPLQKISDCRQKRRCKKLITQKKAPIISKVPCQFQYLIFVSEKTQKKYSSIHFSQN